MFSSLAPLAVVALVGTLALSSCTDPQDEPTQTPTAAALSITAEQLDAVLQEVAAEHEQAKVVSDKQLRASIPAAQQWLEEADIEPSGCGIAFAAPVSEQLKNSIMGAVQTPEQFITVSIYPDAAALDTAWQAQEKSGQDCSRYTVHAQGKSRAYHLAKQPFESGAERSAGFVVTGSDGAQTAQQLMIRAASANVLVGIQQDTAAGETEQQLSDAQTTVDELMDILYQK